MKYLASFFAMSLILVGCNKLDGQLNVTTAFNLKNSNNENKTLALGTYTANLSQSAFGKRIKLQLNNATKDSTNDEFDFTIPKNVKIPDQGNFKLTSKQIGQNVDLNGAVDTKVTDSDTKTIYTQCTYTQPYTVCSSDGRGHQVCSTYYRTIYGSQWQTFFDRSVDQNIDMQITLPGKTDSVADFKGELSTIQRIVTNQTPCF